ncbi:hypothetical protein [Corynebacterium sphenisci]|uniref:hypothetical protein n=1 Tax=Corynebacterium sphenisci TaxID=191493 RepID=UPI0026DF61C9|nr:hypothetical protein [Corynebacterium sphenisci]MDO5731466.1 hypothetical protein [Corynebacterium sphenisci]
MAIANPWRRLAPRTRIALRTIAISIAAVPLLIAVASVGLVAWLISGVGRLDEVAGGPGGAPPPLTPSTCSWSATPG